MSRENVIYIVSVVLSRFSNNSSGICVIEKYEKIGSKFGLEVIEEITEKDLRKQYTFTPSLSTELRFEFELLTACNSLKGNSFIESYVLTKKKIQ